MPIVTTPRSGSSRQFTITTADNGNFLELGSPSGDRKVGLWEIQFNPSLDFVGSLQIMGRIYGQAAQAASAPFLGVPYRRINVAGTASDYGIVTSAVSAAGLIQVPANGLSVAILVTCTAGNCPVYTWSLEGPSAI